MLANLDDSPTETNVEDHQGLRLAYQILTKHLWMVAVVVGVPGNIISAVVTTREHNKSLSPCIYMTALAVADTALLLQQPWTMLLLYTELGDHIQGPVREFLFKLDWYVNIAFGMLSSLYLMEMSIDRLIAVRFPFAVPRLCTPTRAKILVSVTAAAILLINLVTFWNHVYLKDPITGAEVVYVSIQGYPELELLSTTLMMLIGTVIPFVVIAFSNVIIIFTVKSASRAREKLSGQKAEGSKQAHMTRMLIFVSVAYAITSLPYRLYYLISDIPEISRHYDMKNPYWNIRYSVQLWVVFELWCWNCAVNFYLYCIGGGEKYRRDTKEVLLGILRCGCRRKRG